MWAKKILGKRKILTSNPVLPLNKIFTSNPVFYSHFTDILNKTDQLLFCALDNSFQLRFKMISQNIFKVQYQSPQSHEVHVCLPKTDS